MSVWFIRSQHGAPEWTALPYQAQLRAIEKTTRLEDIRESDLAKKAINAGEEVEVEGS